MIEGYATIFAELAEQLPSRPTPSSCRSASARSRPPRRAALDTTLVAVEPEAADCLRRSIVAGEPVTVPGPHDSVMAGLNCGTPSALAWPVIKDRFDALRRHPGRGSPTRACAALAQLGLDRGECAGGVVGAAARIAPDFGPDGHRCARC